MHMLSIMFKVLMIDLQARSRDSEAWLNADPITWTVLKSDVQEVLNRVRISQQSRLVMSGSMRGCGVHVAVACRHGEKRDVLHHVVCVFLLDVHSPA